MCGIYGRVAKERSEREVRSADGFQCHSPGVDGDDSVAAVVAAAAAASVAAAFSTCSKVFVGATSRSQVGWEVGDIVLACTVVLLSSSGCVAWYFFINCGAQTLLEGSQVLSLSGYPFHLIRYCSLRLCWRWARMASTSYSASPSIMSGGGLVKFSPCSFV